MASPAQIHRVGRYTDPFFHLLWLITGGMIAALIIGTGWGKTLLSTTVRVTPDQPYTFPPIELRSNAIGAFRADVEAIVPTNRWLTYELQLKDAQGQVILSALKQAWAESGTWSEEGESGSWAENDLLAGLDVRAGKTEPVTLTLAVLDYSDTSGQELEQPVSFTITVTEGAVDTRYLWAGLVGTTLLGLLASFSFGKSGRLVIQRRTPDSEVGGRAILGGAKNLVRVYLYIKADRSAPPNLTVQLSITDSNGTEIYNNHHTVNLQQQKSDGKVTSARGQLCKFFELAPRDSYKFYAIVSPANSIDNTKIQVREKSRTLWPVEVTTIQASL